MMNDETQPYAYLKGGGTYFKFPTISWMLYTQHGSGANIST